jgi:hypothetical protein
VGLPRTPRALRAGPGLRPGRRGGRGEPGGRGPAYGALLAGRRRLGPGDGHEADDGGERAETRRSGRLRHHRDPAVRAGVRDIIGAGAVLQPLP